MEMNQDIRIVETDLTEEVLDKLIRMSEDWEKENSCHGYRKNEKSDIEGNRIFLAYCGDTIVPVSRLRSSMYAPNTGVRASGESCSIMWETQSGEKWTT